MTRDELAAHLGLWYGRYLDRVGRLPEDTPLNLKPAIDAACRAMGFPNWSDAAVVATNEQGFVAQGEYHTLRLIWADLGTSFNTSNPGGSYSLEQPWTHIKAELDAAEKRVIELFGSTTAPIEGAGLEPSLESSASPFGTWDLNFLEDAVVI